MSHFTQELAQHIALEIDRHLPMIPTKTYRAASMRQDVDTPRHGARGNAWRVPGAADSRAFLFQPDGDQNAYYCEESDLDFEECPCLSGRPDLCSQHSTRKPA